MAFISSSKDKFNRPSSALNYIDFAKVQGNEELAHPDNEVDVVLPAIAKLRPMSYRYFTEATGTKSSGSVICAGVAVLNTKKDHIVITKRDGLPSTTVPAARKGQVWLPLAYASSHSYTISSTTSLSGPSYYIVGDGLLTDTKPEKRENATGDGSTTAFDLGVIDAADEGTLRVYLNGVLQTVTTHYTITDADTITFGTAPSANDLIEFVSMPDGEYLEVGQFAGPVKMKLDTKHSGVWFGLVNLDPSIKNDPVSLPSDVTVQNTEEIAYTAYVSSFGSASQSGLTQNFWVVAANTDPNYSIDPEDISWTINGSSYSGNHVTHTDTAGAKTGTLTITPKSGTPVSVAIGFTLVADDVPNTLSNLTAG